MLEVISMPGQRGPVEGQGGEGAAPTWQHGAGAPREAPGYPGTSSSPCDATSWEASMVVTSMVLLAPMCGSAVVGGTGSQHAAMVKGQWCPIGQQSA